MRLPFQSLFEVRGFSLRDPALARLWGGATSTAAGVAVSEDSALNIAAFWRGVQLISGQIAAMPLHLYKGDKAGAKERYIDSKLYTMVHDAPNREMTAYSFREILQAHLLTWGNAYAEIERNKADRPIALWPLTPDRVTVYRDPQDARIKYRIAPSNVVIEADDILHVPGLGFDGLIGYSVIARARQSLGLMAATERYGATFFGQGAHVGGILTVENEMDDEQEAELRAKINREHQGADRAHRVMLLSNVEGMKYERLTVPPNDAQFLETRNVQVVEMARWLGCPPHKLYELARATFSNIEQQGIEYYTDTIWMWLEKWEQELNRKLIPSLESNYQFFEFDFNGVMRADTAARFNAYHMALEDGWQNRNEVRRSENLNPIPGGDIYQAQLNKIPLDQFRAFTEKKLNPPTPVAPVGGGAPPSDTKDLEQKVTAATQKATRAEETLAEERRLHALTATALTDLRSRDVVPAEEFAATLRDFNEQQARIEALTVSVHDQTREATRLQGLLAAEQARVAEEAQRAAAAEAARLEAEARSLAVAGELTSERDQRATLTTTLEATQQQLQETVEAERVRLAEEQQRAQAADAARAEAEARSLAVAGELATAHDQHATERAALTTTLETTQQRLLAATDAATEQQRRADEAQTARVAAEARSDEIAADLVAEREQRATERVNLTRELDQARSHLRTSTARVRELDEHAQTLKAAEQRALQARAAADAEARLQRGYVDETRGLYQQTAGELTAATELAAAAQAELEQLRDTLHQAEAARTALQADHTAATAAQRDLATRCVDLSGQLATAQQTADEFRTIESELRTRLDSLETARLVDAARATDADQALARTQTDLQVAREQHAAAEQALVAARATADDAAAREAAADTHRRQAEERATVAEAAQQDQAAALLAERDARQMLEQTVLARQADVDAARQAFEQAEQRALTAEAARLEAEQRAVLADTTIQDREQAIAAAQAARQAAEAACETAARERDEARTHLQDADTRAREALATDDSRMLESERRTITATMRRLINRETERIARAGHDARQLTSTAETFYEGFSRLMASSLEEALDGHLTRTGRYDELRATAQRLADDHVAHSRREIQAILTGDGELQGRVAELCERWLQVRVHSIPSLVMQQAVRQLAQRSTTSPAPPAPRGMRRRYIRDPQTGLVVESIETPIEDEA